MPTLIHDHVAFRNALDMLEVLYKDSHIIAGDIQHVEPDGSHTHQWEVRITWKGDEEPTWYILRAWAGTEYNVWALWQDTYDSDMLMSMKLRARN